MSDLNEIPKVPGLHCKTIGFISYSSLQTWPIGTNPGWIASLYHRYSEGTLRYGSVIVQHLYQMYSYIQADSVSLFVLSKSIYMF